MNYYQAEAGRDTFMSLLRNHDKLSEGLSCFAHLDNPEAISYLRMLLDSQEAQRSYDILRLLVLSYGEDLPTVSEIRKALNNGNLIGIRTRFSWLLNSFLPQQH